MLEGFFHDLRFGFRTLARSPGFFALAVLSLSLGIAAVTAMYSVVYAVILHPFPYKDISTLKGVKVWSPAQRGWQDNYTADQFLEIAGRNSVFEAVIASTLSDVLWTGQGEPQRLRGNHITTNTFQVLGVPPLLGRGVTPADDASAGSVCVLGYKFWQRQFGGDPAVLGRQLELNGKVRTVIGVMPQPFMWRGADVYLPIVFHRGQIEEGVNYFHLLGRLKPGVTEAQAEADLHPIIEDLKKQQPSHFPEAWRVSLIDLEESFPSDLRQTLWVLFAAVGLLLLISCANVSNLLLSRAASRQKEMAVRASLGAGRLRLIQQLLTESLLLALAAAALGVPLASFGLRAVIALVPLGTIPDESVIALNTPVLLFTVAVAVCTALFFGLAPALHASTGNLAGSLQAAGRGSTGTRRQAWLRDALVVTEVALSLMLLVGASLMIRTLLALENVNFGFHPERMLTMRVPLSDQRYPDPARRIAFFQELLSRIAALPGVAAAGLGRGLHPLFAMQFPVEVSGSGQQDSRFVLVHEVNAGYPKAYGISPLQGRFFTENETVARRHLAVVNQAFVRRYFPAGDCIGRTVRIPALRRAAPGLTDDSFQITGIVRDIANYNATSEVRPEFYIPYTITANANRLIVLARSSPASVASDIRRQVYAIDPDQPVTGVLTMEEIISEYAYARPRFNLVLFTVFAVLGLALAAIGVYGVISNSVAQRTHEIGVRIALGACFTDITGMVLWRGFKLLLIGIALGLAGSFSTARFLAQQLWSISPFDPVSFSLVSLLLLLIGLQACFWPARRAARTHPTIALRYE